MARKPKKKKKGAQKNVSKAAASASMPAAASESSSSAPAEEQAMPTEIAEAETANTAQASKGPSPVDFVQGTKEELSKVVWPDRQQLISESAAVILMVSFLAIFISLIDNIFSWASRLVF